MGKALIPARGEERSDVVRAAVASADRLMGLWTKDFRVMPRAELESLIADCALILGPGASVSEILATEATAEDVGREVAGLLGSFHGPKDEAYAIFSRNLTLDVAEQGAPLAVLTEALKKVRQTSARRPAIADVLAVLAEKRQAFQDRATLIQKAPQRLALAREVLEGRDRG